MAEKKIVLVDFTARDLNSGRVFDTTLKEVAEREGLAAESSRAKPATIILGKGEMHKALEDEIQGMKAGEERKIVLPPEKAFGERKAQNIVVMPLQNFRENKMMPFPGLVFESNGMQGKVQSVSGGRVRVDFNNPLAGKPVEYEIKLVKEITDKKEAVSALLEKFIPLGEEKDRKFELKGEELSIWLPKQLNLEKAEPFKKVLEKIFTENIDGIKKVTLFETAEKTEAGAKEETAEKPAEAREKPAETKEKAVEKKAARKETPKKTAAKAEK